MSAGRGPLGLLRETRRKTKLPPSLDGGGFCSYGAGNPTLGQLPVLVLGLFHLQGRAGIEQDPNTKSTPSLDCGRALALYNLCEYMAKVDSNLLGMMNQNAYTILRSISESFCYTVFLCLLVCFLFLFLFSVTRF